MNDVTKDEKGVKGGVQTRSQINTLTNQKSFVKKAKEFERENAKENYPWNIVFDEDID